MKKQESFKDFKEENHMFTVGIRKKHQPNDLQYYEECPTSSQYHSSSTENSYHWADNIDSVYLAMLSDLKQNPESYFNFGFTQKDFKAYILKITFCRGLRMFIEKKRLQKIIDYQKSNPDAAFLYSLNEKVEDEKPVKTTGQV